MEGEFKIENGELALGRTVRFIGYPLKPVTFPFGSSSPCLLMGTTSQTVKNPSVLLLLCQIYSQLSHPPTIPPPPAPQNTHKSDKPIHITQIAAKSLMNYLQMGAWKGTY